MRHAKWVDFDSATPGFGSWRPATSPVSIGAKFPSAGVACAGHDRVKARARASGSDDEDDGSAGEGTDSASALGPSDFKRLYVQRATSHNPSHDATRGQRAPC